MHNYVDELPVFRAKDKILAYEGFKLEPISRNEKKIDFETHLNQFCTP